MVVFEINSNMNRLNTRGSLLSEYEYNYAYQVVLINRIIWLIKASMNFQPRKTLMTNLSEIFETFMPSEVFHGEIALHVNECLPWCT